MSSKVRGDDSKSITGAFAGVDKTEQMRFTPYSPLTSILTIPIPAEFSKIAEEYVIVRGSDKEQNFVESGSDARVNLRLPFIPQRVKSLSDIRPRSFDKRVYADYKPVI